MKNGCVCCNLSGALVDQMTKLAKQQKPKFDYMIIEASGVSKPAAIASLFAECEEGYDDTSHEKEIVLSDVAKLDTLVTVVLWTLLNSSRMLDLNQRACRHPAY